MSLSTPLASVYQTLEVVLRAVPKQSLRARSKCEVAPGPSVAATGAVAVCAETVGTTSNSSTTAASAIFRIRPPRCVTLRLWIDQRLRRRSRTGRPGTRAPAQHWSDRCSRTSRSCPPPGRLLLKRWITQEHHGVLTGVAG